MTTLEASRTPKNAEAAKEASATVVPESYVAAPTSSRIHPDLEGVYFDGEDLLFSSGRYPVWRAVVGVLAGLAGGGLVSMAAWVLSVWATLAFLPPELGALLGALAMGSGAIVFFLALGLGMVGATHPYAVRVGENHIRAEHWGARPLPSATAVEILGEVGFPVVIRIRTADGRTRDLLKTPVSTRGTGYTHEGLTWLAKSIAVRLGVPHHDRRDHVEWKRFVSDARHRTRVRFDYRIRQSRKAAPEAHKATPVPPPDLRHDHHRITASFPEGAVRLSEHHIEFRGYRLAWTDIDAVATEYAVHTRFDEDRRPTEVLTGKVLVRVGDRTLRISQSWAPLASRTASPAQMNWLSETINKRIANAEPFDPGSQDDIPDALQHIADLADD